MAASRITCSDGQTLDVQGELKTVMEELHRVSTRREHTFAVLQDLRGEPIALRPEAVLHLRPLDGARTADG